MTKCRSDRGVGGYRQTGSVYPAPSAVVVDLKLPSEAHRLVPVSIVVDDVEQQVAWGRHVVDVEPGKHTVEVHYRWMLGQRGGDAAAEVQVDAGRAAVLAYSGPKVWATRAGRFSASTEIAPDGWYRDPAARYERRYWDGSWTPHVVNAAGQAVDPV
jgi:hypothetical protein